MSCVDSVRRELLPVTGAAHGISAILQMLMSVPDYLLTRPDVSRDVKTTLDFLTSLQQANGNYPCAMDELGGRRPEPEELIHWCHGAPGEYGSPGYYYAFQTP